MMLDKLTLNSIEVNVLRKSPAKITLVVTLIALSTIISMQDTVKAQGHPNIYSAQLATQISINAPATLDYGGFARISGTIATVPQNASETFAGVTVKILHRVGASGNFTFIIEESTNSTSGYSYYWPTAGNVAALHQFQTSWAGNDTYIGAVSNIANVTITIPAGSPTISVINPQTGNTSFTFYTNTAAVGYKFNATVIVNNGTNVASWQVALIYNATFLNATRAWVPANDTQYIFHGINTFTLSPVFTRGSVLIADATLPTQGVNFTTPKKLAIIEFEIIAAPPSGTGNKLSSTLDISTPDTLILDTTPVEIPTFRANGLYELTSVSRQLSYVSISVIPASVDVGASVTINGTIIAAPSAPVTIWHRIDTSVQFTNLTTITTNSASIYTYSWTSSGVGAHQIKANWTGNIDYLGAESTVVSVTVNKVNSTISLLANPTLLKLGENVILNGTISPLRINVDVTVTNGTTPIGTVKTGTDGTYSLTWKPTAEGTYHIIASWSGDSTTSGSTSTTVTVTVAAAVAPATDYTPYVVAVVVIIIIIILFYWYMRRRKSEVRGK